MRIAFITTCMGRLEHLESSLPAAMRNEGHEQIVVDYSCPDASGDWVEAHHAGVRVVRVPGEPHFNLARARNAGAREAMAEWLCFYDADVLLAEDFASMMAPVLKRRSFYTTRRTPGTHLVRRDAFLAVGGYDELIQGWGGEDDDLYLRYGIAGLKRRRLPEGTTTPIPHDDDLRTRHYAIRDIHHSKLINAIYSRIKLDLMRLWMRPLPDRIRRDLRRRVEHRAARADLDEFRMRIPHYALLSPPDLKLSGYLVYRVDREKH